jgi:DNA-binding CsgD family transcriptional regulator
MGDDGAQGQWHLAARTPLAALLDLDLHLTTSTGRVVLLPSSCAEASGVDDLVDAFCRAAVHSVGRHSRHAAHPTPWHAAIQSLAEALPHRLDLRDLVGTPMDRDLPAWVDRLADSSVVHPFCLVLDEPVDDVTWRAITHLACLGRPHGVLVLVASDDPDRRTHLTRVLPDHGAIAGDADETSSPLVVPADSDLSDLVRLIALHGSAMSVARLARLLDDGWLEVDAEVESWAAHGLVVRTPGRRSMIELHAGVDRQRLCDAIPADRRRTLHRRLASELTRADDDVSAAGTLMADALAGAHHALAAQDDVDLIVATCTAATRRCVDAGSLGAALDIVQQALDSPVAATDRLRLLTLAGHVAGRLGEADERQAAFDAALALARRMDAPDLVAEVMATATLTASQVHGSGDELRRLVPLIEQYTDRRPDIRALLLMRQAEMTRLVDPAACRNAALRALEAAVESGDAEIEARALRIAASLASGHPLASDPSRVIERLDALDTPTASVVAVGLQAGLCLASGDRRSLDTLVAQYRVALREHPMALWDADVESLRAVQAIHDADGAALLDALVAMRDRSSTIGAMGGYWTYSLQLLWYYISGEHLPFEPDPSMPVPDQGGVRDLFHYALTLVSVELGRADDLVPLALRTPEPSTIPDGEWTTPTWLPFVVRTAYLTGDRALAVAALDRLPSRMPDWVLLGSAVPIGPVGYFIADTQRMLGRREAAMASCDAGLAAAHRMRSRPWIARCSLQKARFLHAEDHSDDAQALVDVASRVAKAHRLTPIEKECHDLAVLLRGELSGPEIEMLQLVADGMANKQIATHLGISVKRVERMLSVAYRRLGVQNRAEAVRTVLSTHPRRPTTSTD